MRDSFLEVFKNLDNPDAYVAFVKKHGKPSHLPEDLYEVGFENFAPFINSGCKKNSCIYDLGHIHEQYAETFDISDNFRLNATFSCHYCDKKIKYGDFSTCDDLVNDVENLFKKNERVKPIKEVKKKSDLLNLPDGALNGQEMVNPVHTEVVPPISPSLSKTPKPSIKVTAPKPAIKKPVSKARLEVVRRAAGPRLSLIFDWVGVKTNLKQKIVPNLVDFNLNSASNIEGIWTSVTSKQATVVNRNEFCFADEFEEMPTWTEFEKFAQKKITTKNLHKILLNYWRVRLCKDKGLLMSAWMYEMVKPSGSLPFFRCSDRIMIDKNMVLHNQDFPFIIFTIAIDDEVYLLEYIKETKELNYYVISIQENNSPSHPNMLDSFEPLLNTLFSGDIKITTKKEVEFPEKSINSSLTIQRFLLNKYFAYLNMKPENIFEILLWIYQNLNVVKIKKDIEITDFEHQQPIKASHQVLLKKSADQTPKHQKPIENVIKVGHSKIVPVPKAIPKKEIPIVVKKNRSYDNQDHLQTDDLKNGYVHQTPKRIMISKPYTRPPSREVSRDSTPEHNVLKKTDKFKKYDDVKKLLWFYYDHDKQRYQYLLKKVENLNNPEVIDYLGVNKMEEYKTHKFKVGLKNTISQDMLKKQISAIKEKNSSFARNQTRKRSTILGDSLDQWERKGKSRDPSSANNLPNIENGHVNRSTSYIRKHNKRPDLQQSLVLLKIPNHSRSRNQSAGLPNLSSQVDVSRKEFNRILQVVCGGKEFFFRTEFYDDLADPERPGKVNYERVEEYTSGESIQGATVFDLNRRVVIPICEEIDGDDYYRVIIVEKNSHQLVYFDPAKHQFDHNLEIKMKAKSVLEYMKREYKERSGIVLDTKKYSVVDSIAPKASNQNITGLWCLFYIDRHLKGETEPNFSKSELDSFIRSIK